MSQENMHLPNMPGDSTQSTEKATTFTLTTKAAFGQLNSMTKSGPQGGTPMVSRPGKQTIAEYLCFSNGVKRKEYVPTDPMDFNNRPVEEIKERLKVELSNLHAQSTKAQILKQELDDLEGNKMLLTGKGRKDSSKEK